MAVPAASLPLHERYSLSYLRAIISRPYIFTIAFLVANIFVFLLMWDSNEMKMSVLWTSFDERVLMAFGAKTNYSIHHLHEYWRFVTPIFIHVNLFHLMVNMYSLWMIGPWVEKLYGSAKFVVFWVVTGIAGVLGSYLTVIPGARPGLFSSFLIKSADVPSAGASGALFGLVGVLFVFGIKYRRELPEGFKKAFGTGLLPIILLNLGIGFMARGIIDNAAHMGGLLAGAALGGVMSYKRPGMPASLTIAWRVSQVLALILVVVCFGFAYRAYRHDPDSATQPVVLREERFAKFEANRKAIDAGQVAFVDAMTKGDARGIDSAVEGLRTVAPLDEETNALKAELNTLLGQAKQFVDTWKPPRQQSPEKAVESKRLSERFEGWQVRLKNWYYGHGDEFGIKRPGPTPGS